MVRNGCTRTPVARRSAKRQVLQVLPAFMAPAQASSSLLRLLNDATSAGERSIAKNAMPITISRMRIKAPCGIPRSCGAALGSPFREFPLKELYPCPKWDGNSKLVTCAARFARERSYFGNWGNQKSCGELARKVGLHLITPSYLPQVHYAESPRRSPDRRPLQQKQVLPEHHAFGRDSFKSATGRFRWQNARNKTVLVPAGKT